MRTRIAFLVLAGLVLAAVIVVLATREREPEYGGKKLSEWVDAIYRVPVSVGNGIRLDYMPKEAEHALREIGTNAIPYLLDWIRYEPPVWKTKAIAAIRKICHTSLVDHREFRAYRTGLALCVLGSKAEAAIPSLLVLSGDAKATNTARRVDWVLVAMVGREPTSFREKIWSHLLTASDPNIRMLATGYQQQASNPFVLPANAPPGLRPDMFDGTGAK